MQLDLTARCLHRLEDSYQWLQMALDVNSLPNESGAQINITPTNHKGTNIATSIERKKKQIVWNN